MQSKKNRFLGVFVLLVAFDLACGFEALNGLRMLSKPLIVLSLLVYFVLQSKGVRNATFYSMMAALVCSLLGDIFLLFENGSGLYFALGLGAFLLAHILYAWLFSRKWGSLPPKGFWVLSMALITYGGLLFYMLHDRLGALKIPVVCYIVGILAMVITAYRRKENVPRASFVLVIAGALFFVLSDSVLAIDTFVQPLPLSHLIIMSTYAAAQYLIVTGILKQGEFDD